MGMPMATPPASSLQPARRRPSGRTGDRPALPGSRLLPHSLALLVLCGALPLQWQVLADTSLGYLRIFHFPAVLLVGMFVAGGAVSRVAKGSCIVPVAWMFTALTLSRGLFAWYHSDATSGANALQEYFYAACGFFVAVLVADLTRRDVVPKLLLWAGPVGVASFLVFFGSSMHVVGIDAAATFRDALFKADPNIMNFALFKVVFSESANTSANARHEIFGALIFCNLLSLWALDMVRPGPVLRRVVWAVAALALALTMLSLSRAIVLAVMLAALLSLLRFTVASGMRIRWQQALAALALVAGAAPLWALIRARFLTDTSSYQVRLDSLSQVVGAIGTSPLVGAPYEGVTAHNIILDSAYTAGAISGVIAAGLVAYLLYLLAKLWSSYVRSTSLVTWVGLAAGIMPMVRMFTGGSGLLHLSQWVSLGIFLGVCRALASTGKRSVPTGSGWLASDKRTA